MHVCMHATPPPTARPTAHPLRSTFTPGTATTQHSSQMQEETPTVSQKHGHTHTDTHTRSLTRTFPKPTYLCEMFDHVKYSTDWFKPVYPSGHGQY